MNNDKQSGSSNELKLPRIILWSVLVVILAIVIISLPYAISVRGDILELFKLSSKNSDWGDYGSYVGGILGPILSAASILFVWYQTRKSLYLQEKACIQQEQLQFNHLALQALGRIDDSLKKEVNVYVKQNFSGNFDGVHTIKECIEKVESMKLSRMNLIRQTLIDSTYPDGSTDDIPEDTLKSGEKELREYKRQIMFNIGAYIETVRSAVQLFDSYSDRDEIDKTLYNSLLEMLCSQTSNSNKTIAVFELFDIKLPLKRTR